MPRRYRRLPGAESASAPAARPPELSERRAGMSSAIKIAMMAITTSSSMRVNPTMTVANVTPAARTFLLGGDACIDFAHRVPLRTHIAREAASGKDILPNAKQRARKSAPISVAARSGIGGLTSTRDVAQTAGAAPSPYPRPLRRHLSGSHLVGLARPDLRQQLFRLHLLLQRFRSARLRLSAC